MDVLAVVVVRARADARHGPPGVCAPLSGSPLVSHAVRGLLAVGVTGHVHVLVPEAHSADVSNALAGLPVSVHHSVSQLCGSVAGGEVGVDAGRFGPHIGERLERTPGDARRDAEPASEISRVVLVHDAARPFVAPASVRAAVDVVRAGHAAAVPVLPLADTVKRVDDGGLVRATPDRATLRVVQTPQAFRGDLLGPVLAAASVDPVSAWTAAAPAHVVEGHPSMFAVHGAWDAELAALMIAGGPA